MIDSGFIENNLTIKPSAKKLFIFDLDGTIIYDGKKLTPDFANSLRDIVSAGHQIYFATGRSYRDYLPMLPEWCHELPAVTFGGALVTDRGKIIYQKFMDSYELQEFIYALDRNHAAYLIDSHHSYFHSAKESWILHDIFAISGQYPNDSLESVLEEGAYKLLVLDNHFQALAKKYVDSFNWELKYHSYHDCFDVMPANVNKFIGVSNLSLPDLDNIFVFGNDHNDLELMQNFDNNILFGDFAELLPYAKVQIDYDSNLFNNFNQVIQTILKK